MASSLFIGLMSGTSLDGIDAALVDFSSGATLELIHAATTPIDPALRQALLDLTQPGESEIDRLGRADVLFAKQQAQIVNELLITTGLDAAQVRAIGSHGQTIRHRPTFDTPFTLQIGDGNTLAEMTGIDVIADFRRRDLSAGGQGAPLVPAFHADCFRSESVDRLIINIGGMANITVLPKDFHLPVTGLDSGPGNVLLDSWIEQQQGIAFDEHGAWAATGKPAPKLLALLLRDPYFSMRAPKSTGREKFNAAWLSESLNSLSEAVSPEDVQATLLELTARSIDQEIKRLVLQTPEIYLCGGGARNHWLVARIGELTAPATVTTTNALGLHPDWVEACAFAWLAKRFVDEQPGNLPSVTGASGLRRLGCLYPA